MRGRRHCFVCSWWINSRRNNGDDSQKMEQFFHTKDQTLSRQRFGCKQEPLSSLKQEATARAVNERSMKRAVQKLAKFQFWKTVENLEKFFLITAKLFGCM